MDVDDAFRTAARLHELGVHVRSAELLEHHKGLAARAKARQAFIERGGNRAMRRAAARAKRRGR